METNCCRDLVITAVSTMQRQILDLEMGLWALVEEAVAEGCVSADDWARHLGLSRATVYRRIGNGG